MASSDKSMGGVGALYLADLGYPMLQQKTTDEKFDELQDYLYRLVEALRWTLANLDDTNFNENFFFSIVGDPFRMLPMIVSVSVQHVGNYVVNAVLGAIDGYIDGTNADMYEDIDDVISFHAHYTSSVVMELVDGVIDGDMSMIYNVTKGA